MAVWRERFVPFLRAYYRGVKRADPQNKVVLCGFAGVEHLHLDAVYRLGGKDFFDILGAHPYTRPAMPEDGGYLERIRAIREVMVKYGDRKPLWVDEIGWNGVEPSMLEYLRTKFDGHRSCAVTEEDQAVLRDNILSPDAGRAYPVRSADEEMTNCLGTTIHIIAPHPWQECRSPPIMGCGKYRNFDRLCGDLYRAALPDFNAILAGGRSR